MNTQPAEKKDFRENGDLEVHSIFKTIQGEGPFSGHRAIFLRLAGCNLQCPLCFVKNTKIRMADGTQKNIDEVKAGDKVLAYDEKNGAFVPRAITRVYKRETNEILRVYTGNRKTGNGGNSSDLIYCTKEHPFLVKERGWIAAGNLAIGDTLLHYTNSDHMRLFNSIKKKGAIEKLKKTVSSQIHRDKYSTQIKNYFSSPKGIEARTARSLRMKSNNPMYNEEIRVKSFLSRSDRGRKSGTEKKFERIIEGLPVEFVGDGALVVSHKIPDYKITGQNKLIEVWAKDALFAKKRDTTWIAQRSSRFHKAGYELLCVPIPDKNIDREGIRKTVSEFIHNGEKVASVDTISPGTKAWTTLAGSKNGLLEVFNLEVEEHHTYVANGKIVHNCDTDYTSGREFLSVQNILSRINDLCKEQSYLVVITGGEPFRQNIYPITSALLSNGYRVQVETNGSLYQDLPMDVTVVCSPKTGSIHPALQQRISAYKYVLHADDVCSDGLPLKALGHPVNVRLARPPAFSKVPIYLQPIDVGDEEENKRHLAAVVRSCLKHGHILCLQTHKIVGLE